MPFSASFDAVQKPLDVETESEQQGLLQGHTRRHGTQQHVDRTAVTDQNIELEEVYERLDDASFYFYLRLPLV